jgi:hypothetical protein
MTRRICAASVLLSYLVVALGIPLPAPGAPPRKTGIAFPCQDRGCGCDSAEQFMHGCCCGTPQERQAWAEANGIEAAPREEATEQSQEHRSCCSGGCCCCKETAQSDAGEPKAPRLFRALSVLKCHGQTLAWLVFGAIHLPAPSPAWTPALPNLAMIAPDRTIPDSIHLLPDTPPPRPSLA